MCVNKCFGLTREMTSGLRTKKPCSQNHVHLVKGLHKQFKITLLVSIMGKDRILTFPIMHLCIIFDSSCLLNVHFFESPFLLIWSLKPKARGSPERQMWCDWLVFLVTSKLNYMCKINGAPLESCLTLIVLLLCSLTVFSSVSLSGPLVLAGER